MSNTIERALEKQRRLAEEDQSTATGQLHGAKASEANSPLHTPPILDSKTYSKTNSKTYSKTGARNPVLTAANSTQSEPQAATGAPDHDSIDIIIDSDQLERDGMVAPTEKFAKIKEQYRYIKRPLLNNAFGENASLLKHPNLVMVSSSYPSEGKTFTAINLAISMVLEQDRTVLLVDADVINPTLSTRFTSQDKQGLLDYLKGNANVQDIILNTNIPNFKIITAGKRSHHSNEMIASDKMKQLMGELSTRYPDRIVIFDTAPLLGASETHVLSQMVGQAVIVVEEERTTHSQLERALSMLNPDLAVGLVLNKSKSRRRDYYGYYYSQK